MRKSAILKIILSIAFLAAISVTIYQLAGFSGKNDNLGYAQPVFENNEQFDPSLLRLNTVDKLAAYCDSIESNLSKSAKGRQAYAGIIIDVIQKRFYHGYSLYSLKNNLLGAFVSSKTMLGLRAIVIPDDMMKFPFAACSQQSIIGMELFKRKKYPVRKVCMQDPVTKRGHFAYEVNYDNGWHFIDTNQEADQQELAKYGHPSADFLAVHPEAILKAYKSRKDPEFFKRLVMNHTIGTVDEFPAPNAYIFQVVTKFLSYFGWLLILLISFFIYGFKGFKLNFLSQGLVQKQKRIVQPAFSRI